MTSTTASPVDRIRALNDAFRRTFVGGMVVITAGVEAMPADQRKSLLAKVRERSPSRARLRRGRRGRRPLLLEDRLL